MSSSGLSLTKVLQIENSDQLDRFRSSPDPERNDVVADERYLGHLLERKVGDPWYGQVCEDEDPAAGHAMGRVLGRVPRPVRQPLDVLWTGILIAAQVARRPDGNASDGTPYLRSIRDVAHPTPDRGASMLPTRLPRRVR
jgi:hypothetical protein